MLNLIKNINFTQHSQARRLHSLLAFFDEQENRKLASYFVIDKTKNGKIIRAFDANTAILGRYIQDLFHNKPQSTLNALESWKAYPLEKPEPTTCSFKQLSNII